MARAPQQLVVAFSREVDLSLVNDTTVYLERLAPQGAARTAARHYSLAAGNPPRC